LVKLRHAKDGANFLGHPVLLKSCHFILSSFIGIELKFANVYGCAEYLKKLERYF